MTTNVQSVADTLASDGIDTFFGLMGNGNLDLIADMVDRLGIRYVGVRHENGAVAAADGFARASGRTGLATVTHGPGLTNALTALITAHRARTPLLLIAGNATGYRHRSTQRLDQRTAVEALGIPVIAPGPRDDWAEATRRALKATRHGAVMLDLPAEAMRFPAAKRQSVPDEPIAAETSRDSTAIAQAVALLERSQRPLIVAGRGAVRAGVRQHLIELGRCYGARLGTSLAARGFFSDAAGNIDLVGGLGSPLSMEICKGCDVALVVGASLNGFTTEHATLMKSAKVIRLDEDPNAAATIDVHLSISGDLADNLSKLRDRAKSSNRAPWTTSEALAETWLAAHWPDAVFQRLDQRLPDQRTVVFDHGAIANRAVPFFHVRDPSQSIFMPDFGSIGLSVAAATGAAIACPERRTIAITGDGALMMSLSELDTLKRSGAPVLVVVFNDGVYGAEYPHLIELGASREPASFASSSIFSIAQAIGLRGAVIEEGDDLSRLDALVADATQPALVEVKCAPPTNIASH